MPVNFSVRTRSAQLVNDEDSDNVADGGDVIRTTLTIHKTGTAALDVTIQVLLKGSTLLPGSVKIGPMAVDDVATITGNTPKTFTFAELLGNDIDPDGSNATMRTMLVLRYKRARRLLSAADLIEWRPRPVARRRAEQ